MALEEGGEFVVAQGGLAVITDALEFVDQRGAVVDRPAGLRPVQVKDAAIDARGQHRRRETRALFVGPVHHFQRRGGGDIVVV